MRSDDEIRADLTVHPELLDVSKRVAWWQRLARDVRPLLSRAVAAEQERDQAQAEARGYRNDRDWFDRQLRERTIEKRNAEAALAAVRERVESVIREMLGYREAGRSYGWAMKFRAALADVQPAPAEKVEAPGHYDGDGCTFPASGHFATTELGPVMGNTARTYVCPYCGSEAYLCDRPEHGSCTWAIHCRTASRHNLFGEPGTEPPPETTESWDQ